MHRILAVLALLTPALAFAQTAGVTVTESSDVENGDDEIINIQECLGNVRSTFAITWAVTTSTSVDVRLSDTSGCPFPSNSNTAPKTKSVPGGTGASGSLSAQSARSLVTLLGLSCESNTVQQLFVCAVSTAGTATDATGGPSASIRLDGQVPAAPVLRSVAPGDGALDVAWDASNGARRYRVEAAPVAGGNVEASPQIENETSRRISRLRNGTAYSVTVTAYSEGGNPSGKSNAVEGTPVEVQDFWRGYQAAGGREEGGCSTAGRPGALAVLAVALLALRRRRS